MYIGEYSTIKGCFVQLPTHYYYIQSTTKCNLIRPRAYAYKIANETNCTKIKIEANTPFCEVSKCHKMRGTNLSRYYIWVKPQTAAQTS